MTLLCAMPAAAAAQPARRVDVQWTAPAGCPDARYVTSYVARLLGAAAPLAQPGEQVRASGAVRKNAAGNWELALRISVGERTADEVLVASECRALADAMALKAALAADPFVVADRLEPPPEARPPVAAAMPAPTETAPRPARARVRLDATGSLGPMPEAGKGFGVFAALQGSAVRLELGGQVEWGGEARSDRVTSVGARIMQIAGATRACLAPLDRARSFPICAGLELGVMRGAGFGLSKTAASNSLWGAVIIGPAARLELSRRVAAWIEVDALLAVLRPGFYVAGLGTIYEAPSTGMRGTVGVEVDFGT